jgi:hypothetical protein
MDPGNSEGRPGEKAATTTTLDPVASVQPIADIPHGRAYAGPPVPGRGLWAVTVLTCPLCEGMHQHRAVEAARLLSGRAERRCPTTGRLYRLAPVQRRREARRA